MTAWEHSVYVVLLADPRLPAVVATGRCGLQGAGALPHRNDAGSGGGCRVESLSREPFGGFFTAILQGKRPPV